MVDVWYEIAHLTPRRQKIKMKNTLETWSFSFFRFFNRFLYLAFHFARLLLFFLYQARSLFLFIIFSFLFLSLFVFFHPILSVTFLFPFFSVCYLFSRTCRWKIILNAQSLVRSGSEEKENPFNNSAKQQMDELNF